MFFTLHGCYVYFDVQNNEAPELIKFEVHPELLGFGKFLLHKRFLLFVIQVSEQARFIYLGGVKSVCRLVLRAWFACHSGSC
jgi:hypothetical protein